MFNLISLAAAYGVHAWVWQDGHGSRRSGASRPPARSRCWVPLMVFAFLFGLSMDYEVFILARIREELRPHRLDDDGRRPKASAAPAGWSPAPPRS